MEITFFASIVLLLATLSAGSAKYEQDESLNESKRRSGKEKLEEYRRYAESSHCWRTALLHLNSTCKSMTDTEQSRLALSFANCHLERSGRESYHCLNDQTIEECTNKDVMDDLSFQVYTEFFTHAGHLCYFIQSQLWQENTERTIDQLSYASTETVNKLEQSLEYQRELDKKQTKTLENQKDILDNDMKIASSLLETKGNMDQAFKEMFHKTEAQKLMLNELFDSLNRGFNGVQWLLSSILGEIISLETAAFFVTAFLFVTFLPQFGMSRIWLYVTLIVYGLIEGGVRRCVLWLISPQSQDAMGVLHVVLWYSRWAAVISLGLVYFWRYLVHSDIHSKQLQLLEDVQKQVSNIHNVISPHNVRDDNNHMSSFVAEETDMYCCPLHEHLTPDNEVVALNEVYDNQCTDKNGQFISGTQLLDFLSGLYIRQNIDTIEDSDTDSSYAPPTTTSTVATEDYLTTLERTPINKLPLTSSPALYQSEKEINVEKEITVYTSSNDKENTQMDDSGISVLSGGYNLRPRHKVLYKQN